MVQRLAWCAAVLLPACAGLQESEDLCSTATAGHGNPCGECGVLQCSAQGGLTCVTPAEPRDDVRVVIPSGLQRALRGRPVSATVNSDLEDAPGPRPIPVVDGAVQGCLPGLRASGRVQISVGLTADGVRVAELDSGPVAITLSDRVEVSQPGLNLPDDDGDGALNLEEVLDDPALASDPRAVPDGFRDRLVDIIALPRETHLDVAVPVGNETQLVFTSSVSAQGTFVSSAARVVHSAWHGFEAPVSLPCIMERAVGHPTRALAAVLCIPSEAQALVVNAVPRGLYMSHQVELPSTFSPAGLAIPGAASVAFLLGRDDAGAALLELDLDEGSLNARAPLPELTALRDLAQAEGRFFATAPEDGALVELDLDGDPAVRARLDLPGTPDRLLATEGGELWVALTDPPGLLVTRVGADGFEGTEVIDLDAPVYTLVADGGADRWIYGGSDTGLVRVNRALRRRQDHLDLTGRGPPAVLRGLSERDGELFVTVAGHVGAGRLGWSNRVGRESGEAIQALPAEVTRLVGHASGADEGRIRSGLPEQTEDVLEDVYDLELPGERLVVVRPTNPLAFLVMTHLDGEVPRVTVRKGGLSQAGEPLALRLPAGPARVGVSIQDSQVQTATQYVFDVVEVPDALETVAEIEDAADLDTAKELPVPSRLSGRVGPNDDAAVSVPLLSGGSDDLEDVFRLTGVGTAFVAHLEVAEADADVDMYLLDAAGRVLERSTIVDPTDAAEFVVHGGGPGPLFIGVTAFGGVETDYRLTVVPMKFGPL